MRDVRLAGPQMGGMTPSYGSCHDSYAFYTVGTDTPQGFLQLLSCADIDELLAHFLSLRDVSRTEVIRQLERRPP